MPVAFYGRTAHAAGTGDSQADRHRQLALCRAVAAACGGQVTAEFFDEDCRADSPVEPPAAGPVPAGRAVRPRRVRPGQWWSRTRGACFPAARRPTAPASWLRLAFRHVMLVLADTGLWSLTAEEYALLGRLLSGPAGRRAARPR